MFKYALLVTILAVALSGCQVGPKFQSLDLKDHSILDAKKPNNTKPAVTTPPPADTICPVCEKPYPKPGHKSKRGNKGHHYGWCKGNHKAPKSKG